MCPYFKYVYIIEIQFINYKNQYVAHPYIMCEISPDLYMWFSLIYW